MISHVRVVTNIQYIIRAIPLWHFVRATCGWVVQKILPATLAVGALLMPLFISFGRSMTYAGKQ